MANYHCSLRIFSRSKGHNAVSLASTRSAEVLFDDKNQIMRTLEDNKAQTLIDKFVMLPDSVDQEYLYREMLWNAAERAETRKNSCVAREIEVALLNELNEEDRLKSCVEMASWLVERYHTAVDVCMHEIVEKNNPYAHILFPTRRLDQEGFGEKLRILDSRITGSKELEEMRKTWEEINNRLLEDIGSDIRIDHRSLKDQGVDRTPQRKIVRSA
jgi:hypothetical protein